MSYNECDPRPDLMSPEERHEYLYECAIDKLEFDALSFLDRDDHGELLCQLLSSICYGVRTGSSNAEIGERVRSIVDRIATEHADRHF